MTMKAEWEDGEFRATKKMPFFGDLKVFWIGDGLWAICVGADRAGTAETIERGKRLAEEKAVEFLLDSLSALGFQEWIPVGEKEPDEGKDYLAVIEYADGSIDSRTIGYWITKRAKFWATKPGEEVTHWREKPALPALPQKGGGE